MHIALVAIVTFHWAILVANSLAFFMLPFLTFVGPVWLYRLCITVPTMSAIANMAIAPGKACILTRTENMIRRKLKKPEIKGFLGHYVLRKK